ncbi:hypothetical protein [Actinomycetospora sp. CA-084318]|uniref:hypothetical protein n=1 Tax=Actinomycetospora sp. CA-084318 TaxID=3239892 RepID=UPI003D98875B
MLDVLAAVAWVWLGMVLAISFLEAPLKFRATGVTLPVGLGIGRVVFRALNAVEVVFAVVVVVGLVLGPFRTAGVVAVGVLTVQLVAVRPVLTRRSDRVLAGADTGRRSHTHLVYVALEVAKVAGLVWLGVTATAAS